MKRQLGLHTAIGIAVLQCATTSALAQSVFDRMARGGLAAQINAAKVIGDHLKDEKSNAGKPVPAGTLPPGTPLAEPDGRKAVETNMPARLPNVAPVSVSKIIRDQSDDQRVAVAQTLQTDIDALQTQLDERLALDEKTPKTLTEIAAINETLSAKRKALSLALGKSDEVTSAAVESVLNTSNPFFLVCGTSFWARSDPLKWSQQFEPVRAELVRLGHSIGAIMVKDRLAGTGFTVGTGLILTNAHVLRDIAEFDVHRRVWRVKPGTTVTFDLERRLGSEQGCDTPNTARSYNVSGAVYAGVDASNLKIANQDLREDIAVLLSDADAQFPPAVTVATRPAEAYVEKMVFGVIGYPWYPKDMTIAERMQYFSAPATETPVAPFKRLAGGFSADRAPDTDGLFPHLVNTAQGNSGSPIVDLADGSVVGIHVRGEDRSSVTAKNWGIAGDRIQRALKKAGVLPP